MVNSILFPKEICKKLLNNKDITKYTDQNVFPLIADNKVKMPFIVYTKDNVTNITSTKDGFSEDVLQFTIWIVSETYFTSLEIANEVRKTFEHKKLKTDDYSVTDCIMTSINESFEENAYLQILSFKCNISN